MPDSLYSKIRMSVRDRRSDVQTELDSIESQLECKEISIDFYNFQKLLLKVRLSELDAILNTLSELKQGL